MGPVALDYARNVDSPEIKNYATIMLIVAVLSIIITSPIGALLIMQFGPRLLHRTLPEADVTGISNPAISDDEVETPITSDKKKYSKYNTI